MGDFDPGGFEARSNNPRFVSGTLDDNHNTHNEQVYLQGGFLVTQHTPGVP